MTAPVELPPTTVMAPAAATVPIPAAPIPAAPIPAAPLPAAPAVLPDRLRVARLLLLLEVLVAAVATVESAVVAGVGLGSPLTVLVTLAVVVVLALAARSVGRGRGRRFVVATQVVLLLFALADVVIAAFLRVPPPLVVPLVRIALPATVLVLVRGRR